MNGRCCGARTRIGLPALLVVALATAGTAWPGRTGESFDYYAIDVPCSACPGGIARRTALGGINPAGDIVDPSTGQIVAGVRGTDGRSFIDAPMPTPTMTTSRQIWGAPVHA